MVTAKSLTKLDPGTVREGSFMIYSRFTFITNKKLNLLIYVISNDGNQRMCSNYENNVPTPASYGLHAALSREIFETRTCIEYV